MGVATAPARSPKTPRSLKKAVTVDVDALITSIKKSCRVTPGSARLPLLLDEKKRVEIERDLLLHGYHLILRYGVASALLTRENGAGLRCRLSGRAVRFVCRGYDSEGGSRSPSPRSRRRSDSPGHIEI